MAGQIWSTNSLGGFMWSANLSRKLRTALQPLVRFRQFCDAKEAFGVGLGEFFNWNVYSDAATEGRAIAETETMPESGFTISQASLTITEYGNSVPFTKKLDDLSEQPVTEVVHKVLKNDARKVLDKAAHVQFSKALLRFATTSSTAYNLVTSGLSPGISANALGKEHVKLVADELAEREVPSFDGNNYMACGRPSRLRQLKNDLESIHQYVSEGWHVIMNGEKGRYEGIRFIEQTNIADVGAFGEIFFFGADTVVEAFAIPEEVRGKIPTDYGRSRGIAWYAELGYGIVHPTDINQARIIVMSDFAAP